MSTVLKSTTVKQTKKKGKFFEWLGLGVGTVVARTWKFGANKEHTLVLEHDCMTGRRQVYLDKKLVHNQTVFPDRSFEIFVQVDGKTGKVVVENKVLSLQVHYHFYYDGVEQVSRMFDSSCRNSLESVMKVSVPDIEVVVSVTKHALANQMQAMPWSAWLVRCLISNFRCHLPGWCCPICDRSRKHSKHY